MRTTDTVSRHAQGSRAKRVCCTDEPCDSGLRNRYFEGKRLTADSFRVEQSYLVDRRHLLNRAVHGWGVVFGYPVKPVRATGDGSHAEAGALEIGPGLALDECGRELLLASADVIHVEDVVLLDGKGATLERPPQGSYEPRPAPSKQGESAHDPTQESRHPRACWLLSAHYAERLVAPVDVSDPCSCERREWEQVCETVRFSLRRVDCDECCRPFDCELTCGCGTGPCCEEHSRPRDEHGDNEKHAELAHEAQESPREPKRHQTPLQRGGCQCLCEHLTGLADIQCGGLRDVADPCAQVRADLCHGVPLACVSLREGDCEGEWLFDPWIEACGPRRLVKRNDALFDLIRGCDLTRISAIGWARWHRSRQLVDWNDFEASFGDEEKGGEAYKSERRGKNQSRRKKVPVLTKKYWVEFSRPVRSDTLRADCFAMTVLFEEREGGWDESLRVPILDVDAWAPPGTPEGLVTRATIVVDAGWLSDAVKGNKTIFNEDPATVEIEIRGDFIVDCNGQTVDANASGLSPAPTGNGTPGGTFYSSFHVQPRYAEYREPDESAYRTEGVES